MKTLVIFLALCPVPAFAWCPAYDSSCAQAEHEHLQYEIDRNSNEIRYQQDLAAQQRQVDEYSRVGAEQQRQALEWQRQQTQAPPQGRGF